MRVGFFDTVPQRSSISPLVQVLEVEEEMRLLLMEKAEQKKNLELRITKLSDAFAALRDDL